MAFPAWSHLRLPTLPLLPRRAQKLHRTNKVGIKLPFDQRVKIYAIREYQPRLSLRWFGKRCFKQHYEVGLIFNDAQILTLRGVSFKVKSFELIKRRIYTNNVG